MTVAEYTASRPDLRNNWDAVASGNYDPSSESVAQYIRGFSTFEAYAAADASSQGIFLSSPAGSSIGAAVIAAPSGIVRISHPITGWPIDVLPSWTRVGSDSAGNPVFQTGDSGGNVVQFVIDGNGQAQGAAYVTTNGAIDRAKLPVLPPSSTVTGPSNPPITTTTGAAVSPLFDPTHRFAGYTAQGYEVYRLTDEGGQLKEWYDIPGLGATGIHTITGPNDPASYVGAGAKPTAAAGGSPAWLLIGAAAVGLFFLARQNR